MTLKHRFQAYKANIFISQLREGDIIMCDNKDIRFWETTQFYCFLELNENVMKIFS